MRLTLTIELPKELETKLRELTAEWASSERMEETNSVFQIQAEQCLRTGIRLEHAQLARRLENSRRAA